ncbi:Isopenicillin N epimerase [Polaribacter huanghezhanensis]|uniref:aminotransferase class V-fold PLP-dependent enzyme n=1 Tax=Polaribacter huanghezhanensis TaxID=1354726 RepID=UPI002648C7AB|nr:aminotransferase class V-fold PLP-dependent enzyme [Polaribacter huanghezhanensis]WKD84744.1 Isopenicillin N epimerase [Polaribacter huanghezhanensis]
MSKATRRSFLQKSILGGLFYTVGIPFLQANNSIESVNLDSEFKLETNNYNQIDWKKIRAQFLFPKNRQYLNTASLGPSPRMVVNTVCKTIEQLETQCSHGHHLTKKTHQQIAQFLNTSVDEIAVIRNATEGMNIIARTLRLKAGDEVIISTHEHVGGAAPWMALQKDLGIVVKLIDLDVEGEKNLQIIKNAVTSKTKAIAFSHITCTNGMKLPAKEIAAFCRSKNIYSCIDGAQALGMFSIDLTDIQPDFYTSSGHKWLFGPKGTGVFYMHKKWIKKLNPVFVGAYSDSKYDLNSLTMEYRDSVQREEYGTRNAAISLGLGSAIEFISEIGIENVAKRGRELANYFRKGLKDIVEIEILTPENEKFSASMITFKIHGKDNLKINQQLNSEYKIRLRGIYENNLNSIRVSFAIFNTFKEIDNLLIALKEITKN